MSGNVDGLEVGIQEGTTSEHQKQKHDEVLLKSNGTGISQQNSSTKLVHIEAFSFQSLIKATPAAARDWHSELLLGLFLNSDETELDTLGKTTGISLSGAPDCAQRKTFSKQLGTAGSTMVTLIPELLRNYSSRSSHEMSVPPEWRRFDFASKTLSDIKQDVHAKFESSNLPSVSASKVPSPSIAAGVQEARLGVPGGKARATPFSRAKLTKETVLGKDDTTSTQHVLGEAGSQPSTSSSLFSNTSFKPFSIKYNECSLSAISRWAARTRFDYAAKEAEHKLRTLDLNYISLPVVSPLFRRCLTCHRWGHYDIECDNLEEEDILSLAPTIKIQKTLKHFVEEGNSKSVNETSPPSAEQLHSVVQVNESSEFALPQLSREQEGEGETTTDDPTDHPLTVPNQSPDAEQKSPNTVSEEAKVDTDDDNEYLMRTTACEVCGTGFRSEELLLCDGCDCLFHCQCLDPPLKQIPEGDWFCDKCTNYDSDVSSVVELEACEGFVFEQRKYFIEEKPQVQIGFPVDGWDAAVGLMVDKHKIVPRTTEPKEKAQEINNEDDSQERASKKSLAPGDACWAMRRAAPEGKPGRDHWWPSTVVGLQDDTFSNRHRYLVKFHRLPGAGRVRTSDVLPFLPYFEEFGQKRLFDRSAPSHNEFRKALKDVAKEAGCESLARGLMTSQEAARMKKKEQRHAVEKGEGSDSEEDKKMPAKSKFGPSPAGWEDSYVSEEGGFALYAKKPDINVSWVSEGQDTGELEESEKSAKTTAKSNASHYAILSRKPSRPVREYYGAIVSHTGTHSQGDSRNVKKLGIVEAIDEISEAALVRFVPELGRIVDSSLRARVEGDNDNGDIYAIQACHIGASMWVPLNFLDHVLQASSPEATSIFKRVCSHRLKEHQSRTADHHNQEAIQREENMIELGSSSPLYTHTSRPSREIEHAEISVTTTPTISGALPKSTSKKRKNPGNCSSQSQDRSQRQERNSRRTKSLFTTSPSQVVTEECSRMSNENEPSNTMTKKQEDEPNNSEEAEDASEAGIFLVEKILDERTRMVGSKKRQQYYIKWRGFGEKDCSWEPESHINYDVLNVFHVKNFIKQLKETNEAKNRFSLTATLIRRFEERLDSSNMGNVRRVGRICPFCEQSFERGQHFGGHARLHRNEPNYDVIKGAVKLITENLY